VKTLERPPIRNDQLLFDFIWEPMSFTLGLCHKGEDVDREPVGFGHIGCDEFEARFHLIHVSTTP
jgi:hypothetical protein